MCPPRGCGGRGRCPEQISLARHPEAAGGVSVAGWLLLQTRIREEHRRAPSKVPAACGVQSSETPSTSPSDGLSQHPSRHECEIEARVSPEPSERFCRGTAKSVVTLCSSKPPYVRVCNPCPAVSVPEKCTPLPKARMNPPHGGAGKLCGACSLYEKRHQRRRPFSVLLAAARTKE
ncbi:hypothetical protein B0H15DRAFT_401819 [Mycena belliarum]|uniref:GATA-type domain-containing protein n=1 Tax=Mycena belliarum TaxID=1033014 RepID=A0AAD6U0M3_9AGAR|nr:hypothetical protein B0H15DRAFT_401819 [Mycena belliae]